MSRSGTTSASRRSSLQGQSSMRGARRPPRRRKARRGRSTARPRRPRRKGAVEPKSVRERLEADRERRDKRRVKAAFEQLKDNVLPLLSREEIEEMAREAGFSQREAKAIHPFEFVLSCVLACTLESKRGFASVWRVFGAATGIEVARSAITQRFGEGSAALLQMVFEKAVERVPESAQSEQFAKIEQFSRVLAHDGSVLALSSLLGKLFPATRTNSVAAAAKVHATADVLERRIVGVEVTGERKSELHVAWDQPVVCEALYLVDLGYYCHDYYGSIVADGGHIVSRLKDGINVTILEVVHGIRAPRQAVGKKLSEIDFVQSHNTFDILGELSTTLGPAPFRIVGVRDAETGEYHMYITDLPPNAFTAEEIAKLYTFRWVIELLFKQLKSYCHLDHVDTSNPDALRTHIYASLTASLILHALLVTSAQAAGMLPSDLSHLTVAAAAPLLAVPLLLLWMDVELSNEQLAQMLIRIIVVGCREQNPGRRRRQWGGLGDA